MENAMQLSSLLELDRTGQPEALPWDDRLATGLPEMDTEHRQLVELINQLGRRRAEGAAEEELLTLLGELRRHIVDHFQNEADLMQCYAISDAHRQLHSKAHQGFIDCLDSVGELVDLDPAAVIDHLLALLGKWLAFHIDSVDRRLAERIIALRAGVPAGQAMAEENTFEDTLVDTMGGLYGILGKRTFELVGSNSRLRKSHDELQAAYRKLQDAQSQLLQSEKMASIGQLAAGVAHEINNPIGYVSSNLGSLQKYLENILAVVDAYEKIEPLLAQYPQALADITAAKGRADLAFLKEDVPALMSESREGITRVRQIVQNLKDFSHAGSDEEWQQADLRHGLESTLNIVWNELKYKCEVKKDYAEIPNIECLPSQLNQVFMNLLVNAAYAIEGKGIITIRTGTQGDHVWVEVADTGKGIAPENLDRIFDPFFTTKPVGKGTGLGLSVSYSILQTHHGRINVASEVGKGTTFHILLPVKQPKAEHEAPRLLEG